MARYIVVHTPIDTKVHAGDTFSSFAKDCVAKSGVIGSLSNLGMHCQQHGLSKTSLLTGIYPLNSVL